MSSGQIPGPARPFDHAREAELAGQRGGAGTDDEYGQGLGGAASAGEPERPLSPLRLVAMSAWTPARSSGGAS